MAERAFTRLEKKLSTSLPAEAKTPMPVMATLRMFPYGLDERRLAAGGLRPPLGQGHQVGDVLALEHPGEAVDRLPDVLHVLRHGVRDVDLELRLDRKSTRLNSSHRCISYAVFC